MLDSDETALLYIKKSFDDSIPKNKLFHGGYVLIFPDGELYISASFGIVRVTDYDGLDEQYKMIDPSYIMPFVRVNL